MNNVRAYQQKTAQRRLDQSSSKSWINSQSKKQSKSSRSKDDLLTVTKNHYQALIRILWVEMLALYMYVSTALWTSSAPYQLKDNPEDEKNLDRKIPSPMTSLEGGSLQAASNP